VVGVKGRGCVQTMPPRSSQDAEGSSEHEREGVGVDVGEWPGVEMEVGG
jgi:hypothetical protein